VAGILPTAADTAMQTLGLPSVAASLQHAQFVLGIAVEADRFQALPIASHRCILDA
jgi:hypothetical protein